MRKELLVRRVQKPPSPLIWRIILLADRSAVKKTIDEAQKHGSSQT